MKPPPVDDRAIWDLWLSQYRLPVVLASDELGVFGLRSWEKHVPEKVFAQPPELIATFLRHLWATDGCIWAYCRNYPVVRYDSSSEHLSRDVSSLLLRLGITASAIA